jgi:hypothetical protein
MLETTDLGGEKNAPSDGAFFLGFFHVMQIDVEMYITIRIYSLFIVPGGDMAVHGQWWKGVRV